MWSKNHVFQLQPKHLSSVFDFVSYVRDRSQTEALLRSETPSSAVKWLLACSSVFSPSETVLLFILLALHLGSAQIMVVPVCLFNAVRKVLGQLSSLLTEKYDMYLSFENDLFNLESDLIAISKVLSDAEKQQERNSVIQDWLERLQIVLYDAEDLLDDLNAEALRQNVEAEWSMVTWVRNVYFRSEIDGRIKEIRGRISTIENKSSPSMQQLDHDVPERVRDTLSSRRFNDVVGREEDKKKVIELLCGDNSHGGPCVVPIVGMGGLGKTALAQLVFDDEKVKSYFDLRIWVDVYDDLCPNRIMQKKIITAVNSSNVPVPEMNTLSCLQDKVSEKKFLLVLDDVWNCNRVKWLELKHLLGNGARGSGIVLTTRNKTTAEITGTIDLYSLSALPNGECWSLFEKWAFGEGESAQYPNLKRIGEDIVNKCGGVPLAIRTVGGLLSASKQESYWRLVKDSDTWDMGHWFERDDGILSVLKLSYDQLPSQLKDCFAYCSLLPKGQAFDKQELMLLWMAQGFIHSSNREQQLEDIGSWYVNEFVSRSIFDVVHENHKAEIVKCRMHDLYHDLAKSVAGNLMVNSDTTKMSVSTRHVSFWDQKPPVDLSRFLKLQKLRTLLLPAELEISSYSVSHLYVLLSGSTYLRALDLSNSSLKLLPNSIGNMKHLRYLNLNGNTELQALPESICRLHSLQTLKLSRCRKISTFPRNFHYLVSLRHLVITSPFDREKRLGTLTSLRWLTLEHCRNLGSLSEVTRLNVLRTLCIHNCGKLTSLPRNLENCTALESLEVVNCPRMKSLEVCMQGLSRLKSLTIKGLPKLATLPDKLECYARSLQYLFITDCVSLMTLPDCLGNLSSLMRLYIKYCPNLQNLPHGFSHLTALQVLQIDGCPNISTRCHRNVGEDWKQIA